MLPSSSSPSQPVLINRTNFPQTRAREKSWFSLLSPPSDKGAKRPSNEPVGGAKKRVKLTFEEEGVDPDLSDKTDGESDSGTEVEDVVIRNRNRKATAFQMHSAAIMNPIGRGKRPSFSTRAILESFVSSTKFDVFKCQSTDVNSFLTLPYACSYTKAARDGGVPLLAVATEQGSVHIVNTSRREDWDLEPPRITLQPHNNGIFDIKWNITDDLIATCSGDKSTHITCPETKTVTHTLRGHTSTVKCAAWDPNNRNILVTGGRDGTICIWDLRASERRDGEEPMALVPVMVVPSAHEEFGPNGKAKPRRGKNAPMPRTVTSLLFPDADSNGIISSGAFDGILRHWDIRQSTGKSRSTKPRVPASIYSSPVDPTTLHGSRRSRGIVSLASGSGPTAGIIFALGADSRIHTYTLPSLTTQTTSYTHENMQTNSFYVGLAMSPCGRWLASGSTGTKGSNFLFDVSNAARPCSPSPNGVELRGQLGEVGALDWADNAVATCADDGTVRVWRPHAQTYKSCIEQPEEKKWDWCWSVEDTKRPLN